MYNLNNFTRGTLQKQNPFRANKTIMAMALDNASDYAKHVIVILSLRCLLFYHGNASLSKYAKYVIALLCILL